MKCKTAFFLTHLAGRKFHEDVELKPGVLLRILHQPDNPVDVNALSVNVSDSFSLVGYIPAHISSWLTPLVLTHQLTLQARLVDENPESERPSILLMVSGVPCNGWKKLQFKGASLAARELHQNTIALWQKLTDFSPAFLHEAALVLRKRFYDLKLAGLSETRLLISCLRDYGAVTQVEQSLAVVLAKKKEEEEKQKKERIEEERQKRHRSAVFNAIRKTFACKAVGNEFLEYGDYRILPLKAIKAANVPTVNEAIEDGSMKLISAPEKSDYGYWSDSKFWVAGTKVGAALSVKGALIRFPIGETLALEDEKIIRCENEYLITEENEFSLGITSPEGFKPFDSNPPRTPVLPEEATGFAIFLGNALMEIRLYGNPVAARESMGALPRRAWRSVGRAQTTFKKAIDAVRKVLSSLAIFGIDEYEFQTIGMLDVDEALKVHAPKFASFYFGHQYGVLKGAGAVLGPRLKLAGLTIELNYIDANTLTNFDPHPWSHHSQERDEDSDE